MHVLVRQACQHAVLQSCCEAAQNPPTYCRMPCTGHSATSWLLLCTTTHHAVAATDTHSLACSRPSLHSGHRRARRHPSGHATQRAARLRGQPSRAMSPLLIGQRLLVQKVTAKQMPCHVHNQQASGGRAMLHLESHRHLTGEKVHGLLLQGDLCVPLMGSNAWRAALAACKSSTWLCHPHARSIPDQCSAIVELSLKPLCSAGACPRLALLGVSCGAQCCKHDTRCAGLGCCTQATSSTCQGCRQEYCCSCDSAAVG